MSSTDTRGWSLQRRLAWQLVLGIGLLLGGLFLVLDLLVDQAMYRRLDQFLDTRAQSLAAGIVRHDDEELEGLLAGYDMAGHDDFFAVYADDGRLRLASSNSGPRPLSAGPQRDSPHFQNVYLPDGHRGRAVEVRLGDGGWLVMATERESWDRTERAMHGVLLLGTLVATALAVLLCLWLLRKAFVHMREDGDRLAQLRPGDALPPLANVPIEVKPYARAVREAMQRLMDAVERERRFSRNIAHEMRTPLAEVRASAEHALVSGDAEAARRGLDHVLAANARMERGMAALLALVRYESGQDAPAPDPLDLVALVRQQARSLGQAEGFDVATRFDFELPGALWIHSDAGMLERILTNLLHNAHEYGDRDTAVRVGMHESGWGWSLEIRNAASGVDATDLSRFGERYWRGAGEDADATHAGLGVALSSAMAHALGLRLSHRMEHGEVVATLGDFAAL